MDHDLESVWTCLGNLPSPCVLSMSLQKRPSRYQDGLLGLLGLLILGDRIKGTLGDIDPLNKVPV